MPILQHIFKKGQQKEAQETQKRKLKEQKRQEQKEAQPQEEKEKPKSKKQQPKSKKAASSAIKIESAHSAYGVVVRPHVSEKSVEHNSESKYVFEIASNVSKKQVKDAIEVMYGVKVESVNKIKVPAKKIRYRMQTGTKPRHNKAVVTLKKGQEIEVLPQ